MPRDPHAWVSYPSRGGRVSQQHRASMLGYGYPQTPENARRIGQAVGRMSLSPGHYDRRSNPGRNTLPRIVGNRMWDPRKRRWVKLADDPRMRQQRGRKWDHKRRRWVKAKNDPRQRYDNMSGGRGRKWDPKRRKWVKASVFKEKKNKFNKRQKKSLNRLRNKRDSARNKRARRRYQRSINRRKRRYRRRRR